MAKKSAIRVALDLETTGLHPEQDAILEIAAVKFQDSEIIDTFEKISAYIEPHSHTEEKSGAPPEPKDLESMIVRVDGLIKRAKAEKKRTPGATGQSVLPSLPDSLEPVST